MIRAIIFALLTASILHADPTPWTHHKVFDSAFSQGFACTDWGPIDAAHKWIAHTPYAGDFGGAWFGLQDGSELTVNSAGQLVIKAWYDTTAQHWRSGLISSADTNGNGFVASGIQYWESTVLMPAGAWPSVWILGKSKMQGTFPVAEIDIVEAYNDMPYVHQTTHVWNSGSDNGTGAVVPGILGNWAGQWVKFAVLIWTDYTYFYVNDVQTARFKTDPSYLQGNFVMVDLAVPDGLPQGPPMYMLCSYVQCWQQ